MKRSFQEVNLVAAGTTVIAATYGLVRCAYGLVLPAAQADLGISAATAGVVSGLTSVAYCVAAGLALTTCTRWPRPVVLLAGAVGAAGAGGVALADGVGVFAVSVVLASAGAGAASPALVVLVARVVPAEREAAAQSTVNAGPGPGLVVAGLLALAVGERWQAAWVVASLATAAAAVWLHVASRRTVPVPLARGARAVDASAAWLAPAVGAVLLGVGSAAVWTYGRTVLELGGLSPTASTLAWVFLGVGGLLAAPVTPVLLRRGTGTAWGVTLLLTAAGTGLVAVAATAWVGWVAAVLFGLGFTAATTVLIAWATRVSATPGAATSTFFVALLLGQAVGAPLAGRLLDASGPGTALAVAAAATAAGTVVALGRRTRPRPQEHPLRALPLVPAVP